MNASDTAKLRIFADSLRKYRREIERLREALGQETEASRIFEEENKVLFQIVHANHEK